MNRFRYIANKPKRRDHFREVNCPEIPLEIVLENELDKSENSSFPICEYFDYIVLSPSRLAISPKGRCAPIFMFLVSLSPEEYEDVIVKVNTFLEYLKLKYGVENET